MADTIDDIDVSCVGELAAIKEERDRLEGYRARAELLKDKVDAIVYRRVLEDYQTKQEQLEKRAAPLTATARTQYQALLALERRIQTGFHEARLAKEELEFRYEVGELTDAELSERVRDPEALLAERQAELDAVASTKKTFLSVVPSEQVLVEPVRPATPPPSSARASATRLPAAAPSASAVPPAPPAAPSAAPPAPSAVAAPAPAPPQTPPSTVIRPPAATPPPLPSGDTQLLAANPALVADPPANDSAAARLPSETGPQTFLVPDASLEPVDDSTDGARFRLGVVTSIGRSAENHIRLVKAGVSRKHAVIRLTERGFVLEDLGSQNGTFVNGARVPTHDLANGDEIWIGDVKVRFASAWTPQGGA